MDISSLYNKGECIDTKEYSLSIRLMPDGFSFSIHNKLDDNSFRFFDTKSFKTNYSYKEFEDDLLKNSLICDEYQKVNVIIVNDRFTLIPDEFYQEDLMMNYYYKNLEFKNETIQVHRLLNSGCYLIFGMDNNSNAFLNRTFLQVNYFHHLGLLAEYFVTKSRLGNSDKMFCQIRTGMLDIICFKKGKLVFLNSFNYRHNNDVVYFIMNVWDKVGLNQSKDALQISSDGDLTTEISDMLRDYISEVTPVVFPSNAFNLGKECINAPFDIITTL